MQLIYAANYKTIPLLICASIWYLLVTSILQTGQFYVERYYGRGSSRTQQPTMFGDFRKRIFFQRSPGGNI